jgi:N-methylhydantoinase B/oxoprolinase/acetone carboxylase alpha subunit
VAAGDTLVLETPGGGGWGAEEQVAGLISGRIITVGN